MISLAEAQHQVRDYEEDNEDLIDLYIAASTAAVTRYVGEGRVAAWTATPANVRYAVLLHVGLMYADREGEITHSISRHGYLPDPVVALLYPYRKPVAI